MIDGLPDESQDDIRRLLNEGRLIRYTHGGEIEVYLRNGDRVASPAYDSDVLMVTMLEDDTEFSGKVLLELNEADTEQEND